jgi:two-component system response regulator PhoP
VRVLVIEDDEQLRKQVAQCFVSEGFVVDTASDGKVGLEMAKMLAIDVAVIDLGLPFTSGAEIIRLVRRAGRTFPILILTAQADLQSKVEGLEAGADDYLVKPFHREELMVRTKGIMRRAGVSTQHRLECGQVLVDTLAKTVFVEGRKVRVTAYEYKVIEYLIRNAGKVVSKAILMGHLYDRDGDMGNNLLEVFIRRIRTKLDPAEVLTLITTIRGRGYRWNVPPPSGDG